MLSAPARRKTPKSLGSKFFAEMAQEARLYCHGQGYDLVERPLIRQDETMSLAQDMNIVVHPTYIHKGYWNWLCDNYFITGNGPGDRLHQFPEAITEVG